MKNVFFMAGGVFVGYWLMRQVNGPQNAGIRTTAGKRVILTEKDGQIYDQFGGVWT
jgi:hypothetical protein